MYNKFSSCINFSSRNHAFTELYGVSEEETEYKADLIYNYMDKLDSVMWDIEQNTNIISEVAIESDNE